MAPITSLSRNKPSGTAEFCVSAAVALRTLAGSLLEHLVYTERVGGALEMTESTPVDQAVSDEFSEILLQRMQLWDSDSRPAQKNGWKLLIFSVEWWNRRESNTVDLMSAFDPLRILGKSVPFRPRPVIESLTSLCLPASADCWAFHDLAARKAPKAA
jgi:hypothetical protein